MAWAVHSNSVVRIVIMMSRRWVLGRAFGHGRHTIISPIISGYSWICIGTIWVSLPMRRDSSGIMVSMVSCMGTIVTSLVAMTTKVMRTILIRLVITFVYIVMVIHKCVTTGLATRHIVIVSTRAWSIFRRKSLHARRMSWVTVSGRKSTTRGLSSTVVTILLLAGMITW